MLAPAQREVAAFGVGIPGCCARPPPLPVVAGADVRATLKLEPSLPIPDGTASGWLFEFSIVIA